MECLSNSQPLAPKVVSLSLFHLPGENQVPFLDQRCRMYVNGCLYKEQDLTRYELDRCIHAEDFVFRSSYHINVQYFYAVLQITPNEVIITLKLFIFQYQSKHKQLAAMTVESKLS